MATVKVFGGKSYDDKYSGKNYTNDNALECVLNYMFREKGNRDDIIPEIKGGYGVNLESTETIIEDMRMVKDVYEKNGGRQLRHFSVNLSAEETETINDLNAFAYDISGYYGNRYQSVFAAHKKGRGVHIHVCVNSVSFVDGKKFSDRNGGLKEYKDYVNRLVQKHKDTNDKK